VVLVVEKEFAAPGHAPGLHGARDHVGNGGGTDRQALELAGHGPPDAVVLGKVQGPDAVRIAGKRNGPGHGVDVDNGKIPVQHATDPAVAQVPGDEQLGNHGTVAASGRRGSEVLVPGQFQGIVNFSVAHNDAGGILGDKGLFLGLNALGNLAAHDRQEREPGKYVGVGHRFEDAHAEVVGAAGGKVPERVGAFLGGESVGHADSAHVLFYLYTLGK